MGSHNLSRIIPRFPSAARITELNPGRKTVKEGKIRYEDLVKQLKLDYKVNKKRSVDSLGFYLNTWMTSS
jgi:hypothetical protein